MVVDPDHQPELWDKFMRPLDWPSRKLLRHRTSISSDSSDEGVCMLQPWAMNRLEARDCTDRIKPPTYIIRAAVVRGEGDARRNLAFWREERRLLDHTIRGEWDRRRYGRLGLGWCNPRMAGAEHVKVDLEALKH